MIEWQGFVVFSEGQGREPLDVTLHLKNLYDLVVNSMDWGSGFLDGEQTAQIAELGEALGFEVPVCQSVWAGYLVPSPVAGEPGERWAVARCTRRVEHEGLHIGELVESTHPGPGPGMVKVPLGINKEWGND